MLTQAQAEAKLNQLIKLATNVGQEGEHPHKLRWDTIPAKDLQAHGRCTRRGCKGFVFIKIAEPLVYEGTAITDDCPVA